MKINHKGSPIESQLTNEGNQIIQQLIRLSSWIYPKQLKLFTNNIDEIQDQQVNHSYNNSFNSNSLYFSSPVSFNQYKYHDKNSIHYSPSIIPTYTNKYPFVLFSILLTHELFYLESFELLHLQPLLTSINPLLLSHLFPLINQNNQFINNHTDIPQLYTGTINDNNTGSLSIQQELIHSVNNKVNPLSNPLFNLYTPKSPLSPGYSYLAIIIREFPILSASIHGQIPI
jgi:hypothetical protein